MAGLPSVPFTGELESTATVYFDWTEHWCTLRHEPAVICSSLQKSRLLRPMEPKSKLKKIKIEEEEEEETRFVA